ncbi:hypothetical protein AgCh_007041 [Apium graveolens]
MTTKVSTLFMLSLILLFTLTCTARHHPSLVKQDAQMGGKGEESKIGEARSEDGVAEEEGMMRSTLDAHIDYIYTQDQKPQP